MNRWHYTYAGLHITSDLHLPELEAFALAGVGDAPDVDVRLDRQGAPTLTTHRAEAVRGDEYRVFLEGAAEYIVRGGREIVITPAPGAGEREIRLFLLGSAFAALLSQRGALCLHAGVVHAEAGAFALCGPAGSGKSTLTAWLIERGFGFVSDDLCRCEGVDGGIVAHPSVPRLKLWRDAVVALGRDVSSLERDHRRADKFHIRLDGSVSRAPVPLRVIYLLQWSGEGGAPAVEAQVGFAGLRALVAGASYRPDLFHPLGQTAVQWQLYAALAERVPVFTLSRARGAASKPVTLDILEAHAAGYVGRPAARRVEEARR
jgi:hypothetical protein